jgi:hypothetical protein
MLDSQLTLIGTALAIYTVIVFIFVWWENRKMRKNLIHKEGEMQRRMYEVAILKELGDRIGYSLNVQKIVDVITGSLRKLLPYSTVSYLLFTEEGHVLFHCVMEESVNRRFVDEVKEEASKRYRNSRAGSSLPMNWKKVSPGPSQTSPTKGRLILSSMSR